MGDERSRLENLVAVAEMNGFDISALAVCSSSCEFSSAFSDFSSILFCSAVFFWLLAILKDFSNKISTMTLNQKSALYAAIRSNDIPALESILAADRCPRLLSVDDLGFHLLRKSIEHDRTEIARLLLERGCRAGSSSYTGDSPLHLLVGKRRNCSGLVKRLLDSGARVDQCNRRNETAVHVAFEASASDRVVQLMLEAHLKKSVLNVTNGAGLSFLHIACATADSNCVRRFVEHGGADVNAHVKAVIPSSYAGYTPLHMAVEYGRFEVIEYLLQQGADVCAVDADGSTPVHLALELGETDIIELLFDYDHARVNCLNRFGLSHFMASCACSSPQVAQDFLAHKFDGGQFFNANDVVEGGVNDDGSQYLLRGFAPLHFAAIFGRFDIAKHLLADGADCCALTHHEISPAQFAAGNGYQEVAALILGHCRGYDWF